MTAARRQAGGADRSAEQLRISSWTLSRIASVVDGDLIGADRSRTVRRVSTDTRDIDPGSLFVALVGERFDAHDFVPEAFDAGAAAAVVHQADLAASIDSPLIVVEDTLEALQALGHALWKEATSEGLRTIALTGSNGKTTVKEMTAALLTRVGATFATPGNLNNHIGVPLTLCALPDATDFLIVEMGANAPGDIDELITMAPGQTRMITSIGAAHLEGFGDLGGVRRGKSEIFAMGRPDDRAVVPIGERHELGLGDFPGAVLTVGEQSDADVQLVAFEPRGGRPEVEYVSEGRSLLLRLPIPGRHHALNLGTALAATVAEGVDLTAAEIQSALDGLELPGGRWREVQVGQVRFIDDAYNANPTSTVASFDAFMQIEDERPRVAVIGEMLELGESAESQHIDVARRVASAKALSAFVAVGPHAEAMSEAASEYAKAHAFDDAVEAGEWLADRASQTDGLLVFLKGSRGARLEDVIERTRRDIESGSTSDETTT